MKITTKRKKETTYSYDDLKQGDTFLMDNELYIKTDRLGVSGIACIQLSTGSSYSWGNGPQVIPVEVEVVAYV